MWDHPEGQVVLMEERAYKQDISLSFETILYPFK